MRLGPSYARVTRKRQTKISESTGKSESHYAFGKHSRHRRESCRKTEKLNLGPTVTKSKFAQGINNQRNFNHFAHLWSVKKKLHVPNTMVTSPGNTMVTSPGPGNVWTQSQHFGWLGSRVGGVLWERRGACQGSA